MTQVTIPAQVVNGHLQHEMSLAELEGQHVLATLTLVPAETANGKDTTEQPSEAADPEPPPWMDVEQDVYFPMKRPTKRLGKVKVRKRRGKPCIILPEKLPDD